MQKETYGFVYIWRDKFRKRFYIGCHWGREDDGYICSSDWMRHAYKRRPQDFKRRILSKVFTTKRHLLIEEQKWLDLIPREEFGKSYYNLNKNVLHNAWWTDPERAKTVGEKISQAPYRNERIGLANKGKLRSKEHRNKIRQTFLKKYSNGYINPNTGIKKSIRVREINRLAHLGIKQSKESNIKRSVALSGRKKSPEHIRKVVEARMRNGYKHSEETKRKIGEKSKKRSTTKTASE